MSSSHSLCSFFIYFFQLLSILNAENGEVFTWGWKECVPSGKVFGDPSLGLSSEKDVVERQNSFSIDQGTRLMEKTSNDVKLIHFFPFQMLFCRLIC